MKIVVGLGNPGVRYEWTRHNLGFMVLDALAGESPRARWHTDCHSRVLSWDRNGEKVLLAKPLTFMNLSGHAVRALRGKHRFSPEDVLVVLDDLNLPFGRIRLRERGSAGGHHGLESVLGVLESEEVARVRVGVGEDNLPEDKADFVLSEFPEDRREAVRDLVGEARNAVLLALGEGVSKAMSVYNRTRP